MADNKSAISKLGRLVQKHDEEKMELPEYAKKLSDFSATHFSSSTEAANSLASIIQSAFK